MPTPPKPFTVLTNERKSHRTKAELNLRKKGEESLLTGVALKESKDTKSNPAAHKEFLKINNLLKNIEKNDAIYESVINRYCVMSAECADFEHKRESFYNNLEELENHKDEMIDSEEITLGRYFAMKIQMQKQIIDLDKQVQAKRKMLLDIEKENLMTITSALRSIPKKVDETENPLLKALRNG